MTDTHWYRFEDINRGVEYINQSLNRDKNGWLEYAVKASELRFRDKQGDYWFLEALQTSWYRFDGRDWQPSRAVPNQLEGLASLVDSLGLFRSRAVETGDPFEGKDKLTVPEAFSTMVEARRRDFAQGSCSSGEVEELLKRLILVDKQGGFWTVGFRSNRWYCFREGKWNVMEQPPDAQQMVIWEADPALDQLIQQAGAQVITFLLIGAGTLPELVSEPWSPPANYPDLAKPYRTCDLCGTDNPYGSLYCNQCGVRLGCPKCGSDNPPGSRFCNHCGAVLTPSGSA